MIANVNLMKRFIHFGHFKPIQDLFVEKISSIQHFLNFLNKRKLYALSGNRTRPFVAADVDSCKKSLKCFDNEKI
jgi:hypothetical protein